MKKFTLSIVVACTLCVTAAVAQMAPGAGGQGTQQSSPTMGSPRGQQPGMGNDQTGQNGPVGQDQNGNNNSNMNNSEHKLKGCVQSEDGQYTLETKKGKTVALTGQDVAAEVGHEVVVKGEWGTMSQSSTGNHEKAFNVTEVKKVSDTCGKGKHSDMNNSGNMGSGQNTGNTSSGSQGSAGGTSTQPPQ